MLIKPMKYFISTLIILSSITLSGCSSTPETSEEDPTPSPEETAMQVQTIEESENILDLRLENALKELDLVE